MIKTDKTQIVEKIQKLREILSSKEEKFQNPIYSLKKAEQEFLRTFLCRKRVGKYVETAVEQIKQNPEFSEIIDTIEPSIADISLLLGKEWSHISNLLRSKELGKKYPINIVPYNPLWKEMYQKEARFLQETFFGTIVRTEHFGSTAIPGLAAKPVIDILVELISFNTAEKKVLPVLQSLGYGYNWISNIPPGHIMCMKGYKENQEETVRFHLHMAPAKHPIWKDLLFRDYLLKNPEIAQKYEDLKYRLAEKYHYDREAYTEGKSPFIKSIMKHTCKEKE
ncbi:MAG: GrpB family protein [Candidatus Ratteibacteria bacterium]|jgi:GrpB-like predicted nucleotidyltransferase (UPF0157 family)